METFSSQVIRHIRAREFNPQTLLKAPGHAIDYLLTAGVSQNEIYNVESSENYQGIKGLGLYKYFMRYPLFLGDKLPKETWLKSSCKFLTFPKNSRLNVYVTEPVTDRNKAVHTNDFINRIPEAIASFTGPTVIRNLPNNGFYIADREDSFEPFEDTKPSNKRRGAIAIMKDGRVELVDDIKKWKIVRSNFVGYQVLSGTSFYFTNEDETVLPEYMNEGQRSQVSYLVQYSGNDSQERLCFMVTDSKVSRFVAKGLIDHFIKDRGGKSYMAVELDLTDSNCVVKVNGKAKPLRKGGFPLRRDHYVIESSPTAL